MGRKSADEKRKEKISAKKAAAKVAPKDNDNIVVPPTKKPANTTELSALPAIRDLSIDFKIESIESCIEVLVEEQAVLIRTDDLTREEKQEVQSKTEKADRAVAKVFRRASVRVHPDRYGDAKLKEFEDLKQAYSILQSKDSRQNYIEQLLVVIRSWGTQQTEYIQREHEGYVEKLTNQQTQQESARDRYNTAKAKAQGNDGAGAAAPRAYLEAEYWSRSPGWLNVNRILPKSRHVEIGMRFRDVEAYTPVCSVLVVQGTEILDSSVTFEKRIKTSKLSSDDVKLQDGVRTTIILDSHAQWDIRWHAELDVDGRKVITAATKGHMVDLTHPAVLRAQQEIGVIQKLARKQTAILKGYGLHREVRATESLETKSWELHRSMSKGRSLLTRLRATLEILERIPEKCGEIDELACALGEASRTKATFDELVFSSQQRDTMKAFKRTVAAMIESGEVAEWIQTVTKDSLDATGSEANRLYQLLIEGKNSNSLLVDSTTFTNAASRSDLFSEKQCKILQERADEADADTIRETERLIDEDRKEKAEKDFERQMALRAKQIGIERGDIVIVDGIRSAPELNGQIGYYLGVAPGIEERYVVKLVSGKEISLKAENFGPLHGSSLPKVNSGPNPVDRDSVEHTDDESVESVGPHSSRQASTASKANQTDSKYKRPPRTKKSVWIENRHVSLFIGARGVNIKKLQSETRTKIHVDEKRSTGIWVPVTVTSGAQSDVVKALDYIEAFNEKPQAWDFSTRTKQQETSASKPSTEASPSSTPPTRASKSRVSSETNASSVSTGQRPTPTNSTSRPNATISPIQPASATSMQDVRHPPPVSSGVTPTLSTTSNNPRNMSTSPSLARPSNDSFPSTTMPSMAFGLPNVVPSQHTVKHTNLDLSGFLSKNKGCLKIPPEDYAKWLKSQDIETLVDLVDALRDEEFLVEMVANGLKGFKKATFRKMAQSEQAQQNTAKNADTEEDAVIPQELYCPISFILMRDPVLAADGHTYERSAIVAWFAKNSDRTVLSPMTQAPLSNLELTPNVAVRTMAKAYI